MALRRKARKESSSASTAPSSDASSGASSSGASSSGRSGNKSDSTSPAKPTTGSAGLVAQLSDPKTLRRLLLAAKVIGPAVAAGAMKASTEVRGVLDDRRSRRLGVPVDEVAAYKGPTGTVQARITGLRKAFGDLATRRGSDPKVSRFTEASASRLDELSAATSATLSMPADTRRSALRAVSADLDQLDAELMTFLVGPPTT